MIMICVTSFLFFFFQAEDGIRDLTVTGVQTCALPISPDPRRQRGEHHRVLARISRVPSCRAHEGTATHGRLPGRRRRADLREPRHRGAADRGDGDQDRQPGELGTGARGHEGLARLDRHRQRRRDPARLPDARPGGRHLHGAGVRSHPRRSDQVRQGGTLRAGRDRRAHPHRARLERSGHRARVGVTPDDGPASDRRCSRAAGPLSRPKILVGAAISVVLLVYLLWSVDLAELRRQLGATRWGWAAGATALTPLGLWARARRWRYLFPPRSDPPGLVPAVMIGYMANNVLPLRAGEVVRVYVVARRWSAAGAGDTGPALSTAPAALIVERVLDSLAVVLMLAVLVPIVPVPAFLQAAALAVLAIDLVGIAVLVALIAAPARCARLIERLSARWPRLQQRVLGVFETFVRGLDGIRAPSHALPILVWSAIVWVLPASAAWMMLAAMNLTLPWIAGWTVLAFVALGISIPSAPGYVGVFHAAAALAVGLFGVAQAAAVGYALVFHASQVLPTVALGDRKSVV